MSHPLEALARLDGVPEAVEEAREACTELRWHRALRRRWDVVRTESGVRCAWAGSVLDGVRLPLDLVRDVARGAASVGGPEGDVVLGALRAQAEVTARMAPPGAPGSGAEPPLGQLLARLHSVLGHPEAGRPRGDAQPEDLAGLGGAPTGLELTQRLGALADLVRAPLPPSVPALVLVGVVHGELLALRPFARGNAAVARAVLRHQLTRSGVDPVGVVVPEVAWLDQPAVHLSRAAGMASGSPEGAAVWLRHCAAAVVRGAHEATGIADAVLAGRGLVAPADT